MDTQQAYDRIRAYFERPGAVIARDPDTLECVYRGKLNGRVTKCAVGCLIPKRLYAPEFEGSNIDDLLSMEPRVQGLLKGVNRDFLEDAQREHDASESVGQFLRRLDRVAHDYGLQ